MRIHLLTFQRIVALSAMAPCSRGIAVNTVSQKNGALRLSNMNRIQ